MEFCKAQIAHSLVTHWRDLSCATYCLENDLNVLRQGMTVIHTLLKSPYIPGWPCFSLLSTRITGVCHHDPMRTIFLCCNTSHFTCGLLGYTCRLQASSRRSRHLPAPEYDQKLHLYDQITLLFCIIHVGLTVLTMVLNALDC